MKQKIHNIIFKADTRGGLTFDLVLLLLIILSVILVMLESIDSLNIKYEQWFEKAEWIITSLFLAEYILRIWVSRKPFKYIFSTLGIIDFLSVTPMFLSVLLVGSNVLLALRALRLLRVFRLLKLARYINESDKLVASLKASRVKISVFLLAVLILCIVLGTIMYLVEGADNGFTSIPKSVYWCIVTMTTVGFGDIAPVTPLGQFIAALIMILGYGILAVPTGIVSAEYVQQTKEDEPKKPSCTSCGTKKIVKEAEYCYVCGQAFENEK